jgi:L-ascorbate metabolism protein UlaG (beta-lactamase superfamily)
MGSVANAKRRILVFGFLAAGLTPWFSACASQPRSSTASTRLRPTKVTLTYLGTAGWRVEDEEHVLLVDPYVSRLSVDDSTIPLTPDKAAIERFAPPRVDGILVGHSHYDHLLDVPDIALRSGAMVVGTESTLNVVRAAGVNERRLTLVHGGETVAIGPFVVRAIRGLHSLTGQPSASIPHDVKLPLSADGYAEGGTLDYFLRVAGRSLLFIGSANFIEHEVDGLRPDVAIIAVRLREKIPDYSCRLANALGRPPMVLTNHFDAHWEPFGPKQMSIDDGDRRSLEQFAEEIHVCAPDTKVIVPTHLVPMSI